MMYDNPCFEFINGVSHPMACKAINKASRIIHTTLPENNMNGWLSDQILRSMNGLKMINLENNKYTNTICMNILDCFSSIQCNFILQGASVCTPLSTTFRLSTPSPVGTASITPSHHSLTNYPTTNPCNTNYCKPYEIEFINNYINYNKPNISIISYCSSTDCSYSIVRLLILFFWFLYLLDNLFSFSS